MLKIITAVFTVLTLLLLFVTVRLYLLIIVLTI